MTLNEIIITIDLWYHDGKITLADYMDRLDAAYGSNPSDALL